MAHRLNQLRTSASTRKFLFSFNTSRFFSLSESIFKDDQFISSSVTLVSSPRTPGKKLTKGDPIVTGIRLRPFLERLIIYFILM